MAKTGGHFERCNVGCVEVHNKRTQAYLDGVKAAGLPLYFFEELTVNNTHWESDRQEFAGKTCAQIFDSLKKLYTEKTGLAPQLKDRTRINKKTGMKQTIAGWSPIREAVIPIKEDTTVKDFKPVFDWLRQNGLEPIRLDLHKDEGYKNNETGEVKINYHAHLVVCWVDLQTGKTANLKKDKMSEFNQTVLPDALSMEVGTPKAITGIKHRSSMEQRIHEQEERIEQLEAKLKDSVQKLSLINKELSKFGCEPIRPKFEIEAENKRLRAEKEAAEQVAKEAKEKALEAITIGKEKDAQIEALTHKNKMLEKTIAMYKKADKLFK